MSDSQAHPDRIAVARAVAGAMGDDSAAAAAVRYYDQLRRVGHETRLMQTHSYWLVEEPHAMPPGICSIGFAVRRDDNQ